MSLEKLFETQQVLRNRIDYNESDRFEKLILALLVELGECVNEMPEVFKFWSHKKNNREKALGEYVDVLHFALEVGLELGYTNIEFWNTEEKTITNQFIECKGRFYDLYFSMRVKGEVSKTLYESAFSTFVTLGRMIGFTWSEIEAAYYTKNQINHTRQENGY